QVKEQGGPFELVEREVPEPARGEALVRVQACGICHSDMFAKEGGFPGLSWPHVPGHEIAGEIAALGEDVKGWEVGQRVGVGWFGGNCGYCRQCRRGDLINCANMGIPGITFDGGYADYVVVKASAMASIPDELSAEEAAPLLCAGITTYNALRHSGAHAGDLVAVLGVGGLGHLGVQFASKLGFDTVAIARGTEKEELARRLGARHYIDSTAQDPAAELQKLGGARVVLATVTNAPAMTAVLGGLGVRGKLLVVAASMEPMQIPPVMLIGGSKAIVGHASGHSGDSEDTLDFSALSGVRPMIETFPLERATEGYERMLSGEGGLHDRCHPGDRRGEADVVDEAGAAAGCGREGHLADVATQGAALGYAIDDPLGHDELGDRLLERRQRPDLELAHGADPVALAALAVAQAGDLRSEHLGQVLVLGQVGEDQLGRLGEVVLDVDMVGAHGRECTGPRRAARAGGNFWLPC